MLLTISLKVKDMELIDNSLLAELFFWDWGYTSCIWDGRAHMPQAHVDCLVRLLRKIKQKFTDLDSYI